MKSFAVALFILLIPCSLTFAQPVSAWTVNTGVKSEVFSMVSMEANRHLLCTGNGFLVADSNGHITAFNHYLSSGYKDGYIYKAANGDILMLVNTSTIGPGGGDIMLFRMLPDGSIRWIRVFGTADPQEARGLVELPNGDILMAIRAEGFVGAEAVMVMAAIDSTGTQLWQRAYFTDAGACAPSAIALADDGQVLMSGRTADDGLLVKTTTDGQMIWSAALPGCFPEDMKVNPDNGQIFLCGTRVLGNDTLAHLGFFSELGVPIFQIGYKSDTSFYEHYVDQQFRHMDFDPQSGFLCISGSAWWHEDGFPETIQAGLALIYNIRNGQRRFSASYSNGKEVLNCSYMRGSQEVIWLGKSDYYTAPSSVMIVPTDTLGWNLCNVFELMVPFDENYSTLIPYDPGMLSDTGNLDVITYCFPPSNPGYMEDYICDVGNEEHGDYAALPQIWPNPNQGVFKLEIPATMTGMYSLAIFDTYGQVVYIARELGPRTSEITIDLSHRLRDGVYYMQVSGEGYREVVRFAIIHE